MLLLAKAGATAVVCDLHFYVAISMPNAKKRFFWCVLEECSSFEESSRVVVMSCQPEELK
jgi:hypothetical protein